MQELLELIAARRHAPGETVAIATVLRVAGSSYRRTGARMMINRHGRVAGSVSGGCLEQSVIEVAQAALHDGQSRLLTFDTTDPHDVIFGTGLGCHGRISIGVEVLQPRQTWPLAEMVQRVHTQRQPVALLTRLRHSDETVAFETVAFATEWEVEESAQLPEAWRGPVRDVFSHGRNCWVGRDEDEPDGALLEWLTPPLALWVLGAGPDAVPLTRLARELGHEVTVIDRRPALARAENFPAAHRVLAALPSQILQQCRPDPRTAVILMNHHYETDRDTLALLLPLGLPYIALLGPRRRMERMLDELRDDGHAPTHAALNALHAPAGLDLGAETPGQIALSILAEIQAVLQERPGGMLKFRRGVIHELPRKSCMRRPGLIILAAGGSSRMGQPKQLLPWGTGTLLSHACATALQTLCRPVIVVLGNEAEACQRSCGDCPVKFLVNPAWATGLGSSIAAGISALERAVPDAVGALLMLADQPLITSTLLDALLSGWSPPACPIAAVAYGEQAGVPALFARSYFPELKTLPPDMGARALIERERRHTRFVDAGESLVDLDTFAVYRDYLPASERNQGESPPGPRGNHVPN